MKMSDNSKTPDTDHCTSPDYSRGLCDSGNYAFKNRIAVYLFSIGRFFTTIRYGQSTICNMYVEHSEDYNLIGIIPQNLSFCTVKLRRDFLIAQFSSEPCRIMVKMNGFSA